MKYPIIELCTDNTGDFVAQYICFLAKGISMGTYQDGGYLVVPDLIRGNPKTVFFPDFNYSKEFWRAITFCPNYNFSSEYPPKALAEVKSHLLKAGYANHETLIDKISKDWQVLEKPFFEDINSFLDLNDAMDKVSKIKILITPFGTRGSFYPPRTGNNFNLITTSRIDCPAGNIATGILQNLFIIKTKIGGEIGSHEYVKRMSTINFLFSGTVFKKYYPDYVDLTKSDYSTDLDLLKKSAKYLNKLGFPAKQTISQKDGEILLNGKFTNGTFTSQEVRFLCALLNSGEILDFDKAADALWKDLADEKYSLAAMAKVVESIRRKIRDNGIQKNLIHTARGRGYFLSK